MKSYSTLILIILAISSLTHAVITGQENKLNSINTWFMAPMLQKRNTDVAIKKRFFLYPFVYPYYYYSNIETTTAQPSYFWGRTPATSQPSNLWGIKPSY